MPVWRWALLVLNLIALVISTILCWHYLKGGAIIGCDGSGGCEQVLSSQWSLIAGRVPVAGLAMGVYLVFFIASAYIDTDTEVSIRRFAWSVLLILAGSITGMAIWFIIVQKWIIGEFCPYCMTEHITGALMAGVIIWQAHRLRQIRQLRITGLVLCGLVLAGILVASQIVFKPQAVYHDGSSQDNTPAMNYQNVPMIGSPNAPYVIKVLFDYQCPHCQKLHFMLNDIVNQYHGKLAFALCPTPLNTECNPYIPHDVDAFKNSCELAKIGLAVFVAKREVSPAFDDWMFSIEGGEKWHSRNLEATRTKAIELIGQAKLNTALSDPWIEQYIQTCVQLYGQTAQSGRGGVPKLISGSHWIIPELTNTDDLVMMLQNSLGLPKP